MTQEEKGMHIRVYLKIKFDFLASYHRKKIYDNDFHELREAFAENGFDVDCIGQSYSKNSKTPCCAEFLVVALREVPQSSICVSKNKCSGLKIKKSFLLKVRNIMAKEIEEWVPKKFKVAAISCCYATSRRFTFEVYLAGSIELKHKLKTSDVIAAGGSVRDAIGYFNDQVVDAFNCRSDVFIAPLTVHKRNSANIFKYDINMTVLYDFSEDEVVGDFALITKNMPLSKAALLGIDCKDIKLQERILSTKNELEFSCLDDFPEKTTVEHFLLNLSITTKSCMTMMMTWFNVATLL